MKDNIKLVIVPLYRTENEYSFSVFDNLGNSKATLSLQWLEENLTELSHKFNFSEISIEGGEISLLSDIYFELLFKLLETFNKKVSVTTDFVKFNKALINNADVINVSYNFNHNSEIVNKNIKAAVSSGKVINIQSLDVFIQENPFDKITTLNRLKIKAWKIIPYQKTKFNIFESYNLKVYSEVIDCYHKHKDQMQFSYINDLERQGIIKTNNFPINVVYITPNNKFGLGKVDKNNCFYIEEYEDADELEKNLKKYQNEQILICDKCKYKANCLAERYFNPDLTTSTDCSGHKDCLK